MISKLGYMKNFLTFRNMYQLFIQAKSTPNPNFLKFIPGGKIVLGDKTYDFTRPKDAQISPLAAKLFKIDGVTRVFYGRDYVSVSKKDEIDWNELKPLVFEAIMEQFTPSANGEDKPLMLQNYEEPEDTKIQEGDSEAVQMIKEIIETRIRPTVQEDGGDIVFRNFNEENGTVYLYMKGSCAGCPSSDLTLKQGIERMLCHYVGEVKRVEAEDYVSEQ